MKVEEVVVEVDAVAEVSGMCVVILVSFSLTTIHSAPSPPSRSSSPLPRSHRLISSPLFSPPLPSSPLTSPLLSV